MIRPINRKAKVLAVDDKESNLVALQAVLDGECEVISALSGSEAIGILKSRDDIDVILMDIQMPGKDGFETASEIKKLKGCGNIPIIFVTAIYKEEPFIRKGYQVGGVDYFSKPYDPDILRYKVSIYATFRQKADVLAERERQILETEELLKAGRKLSNVLESLPVGVLISDIEGRICQTNAEVARIFSALEPTNSGAYGEILGWWDSSGKMIKDPNGPLARALHTGQCSHNEVFELCGVNGARTKILCSASPLFALDSKILGAVVVVKDVTESQKIEEALEQRIANFISLGVELEHSARQ